MRKFKFIPRQPIWQAPAATCLRIRSSAAVRSYRNYSYTFLRFVRPMMSFVGSDLDFKWARSGVFVHSVGGEVRRGRSLCRRRRRRHHHKTALGGFSLSFSIRKSGAANLAPDYPNKSGAAKNPADHDGSGASDRTELEFPTRGPFASCRVNRCRGGD